MWTKKDLQELIKNKLGDYLFIVVSNRQPYVHVFKAGKIECQRGAGGVITALDPVMRACNGLWVAFGNGDADRRVTDSFGKIKVPPENPSYMLKRVWLTREEEQGDSWNVVRNTGGNSPSCNWARPVAPTSPAIATTLTNWKRWPTTSTGGSRPTTGNRSAS